MPKRVETTERPTIGLIRAGSIAATGQLLKVEEGLKKGLRKL